MLFVYVRPWRRKAVPSEILVKEIYTSDSKVPLNYGYSFSRLKWTHYICPFKVGVSKTQTSDPKTQNPPPNLENSDPPM